jgi:hypothetical protein
MSWISSPTGQIINGNTYSFSSATTPIVTATPTLVGDIKLPTGTWIIFSNTSIFNVNNATLTALTLTCGATQEFSYIDGTISILPNQASNGYAFTQLVNVSAVSGFLDFTVVMNIVFAGGNGSSPSINNGETNETTQLVAVRIA